MIEKIGRNDLCHCGSGKKYKKCCMTKDQDEQKELMQKQKELMQKMKTVKVSAGLLGHDQYFNSKEDILESIRAKGFEPVATEESYEDIDGDIVTNLTVDIYCEHGHSEIGREYTLLEDGKWEFIEEGYSMPCFECEKTA